MTNVDLGEYVSIWYELQEMLSDQFYGTLTFSRFFYF